MFEQSWHLLLENSIKNKHKGIASIICILFLAKFLMLPVAILALSISGCTSAIQTLY